MVASTVYKKGFDQVGAIVDGLAKWMEEKGYDSVAEVRGLLSQAKCPDPGAFERGNYMKALTSFTGQPV
jgi:dihydroorotate dehydrogenase (fumarate)